jgi:hypothetical protein
MGIFKIIAFDKIPQMFECKNLMPAAAYKGILTTKYNIQAYLIYYYTVYFIHLNLQFY